jgi:putative methyltransferase (TIGR04325 family)
MRQRVKDFIKDWCPPALLRRLRGSSLPVVGALQYGFNGNYATWAEATAHAKGYAAGNILEKARAAVLKVKRGEAACERDTVVFDHIQYSYPLLANLLHAASSNDNRLAVLDFGGALGSSYYQNLGYLAHLRELHWMVVEQPHFVACGKADFADGRLSFHETVEEAIAAHRPDIVIVSSVLQYLDNPRAMIGNLTAAGAPAILVDRAPILPDAPTRLTVQTVPPSIYEASYPAWLFNEHEFVAMFEPGYVLQDQFDANIGGAIPLEGATGRYRGYLFARRSA